MKTAGKGRARSEEPGGQWKLMHAWGPRMGSPESLGAGDANVCLWQVWKARQLAPEALVDVR